MILLLFGALLHLLLELRWVEAHEDVALRASAAEHGMEVLPRDLGEDGPRPQAATGGHTSRAEGHMLFFQELLDRFRADLPRDVEVLLAILSV